MELTRRHLLVLLLLAEEKYLLVPECNAMKELEELFADSYIDIHRHNVLLTDKGDKAVAYAVKKAGEV